MATTTPNADEPRWFKSSYSGGASGSDCVEVAATARAGVLIRDSKDPGGPVLAVSAEGWAHFVRAVRSGRWTV